MQSDTQAEIARLDERIKALDRILSEREKSTQAGQLTAEKAADKAETAQQRINAVSNEWRGALQDAQNNFPSKPELSALVDRVVNLEKGMAGGTGRQGGANAVQEMILKILPMLIAAGALVAVIWKGQ